MPVKNIIPGQRVTKEKLQRAKELRREMTPAEKILWEQLRANKLGVHFRRQQVIAGFIVDFYCHRSGLVVEVDGDIHDLQQEEDARREEVLKGMGLTIVRFRNEEVIKDIDSVVGNIKSFIPVLGEALSGPPSREHINKLKGSLKGFGAMKALMEERRKG